MTRSSERDELFTPLRSPQMDEPEPLSLEDDAEVQAEISGNPASSSDNATSVNGNAGETGAERRFRLSSAGSGISAVDRFERILNTRVPDRQPSLPPSDQQPTPRDPQLVDNGPPPQSLFGERIYTDSPAMLWQAPPTRYTSGTGTQLADADGRPLTLDSANAPFVGPPLPGAETLTGSAVPIAASIAPIASPGTPVVAPSPTHSATPSPEVQIAPAPAPVSNLQASGFAGLTSGLVGAPGALSVPASVSIPPSLSAPDRATAMPILQAGETIGASAALGARTFTGTETQPAAVLRTNTVFEGLGGAERRGVDQSFNGTNASTTSDVRRLPAGAEHLSAGATSPLITHQATTIRTADPLTNDNSGAATVRAIHAGTPDVPVSQPARIADQPARGTEQAARAITARTPDVPVSRPSHNADQPARGAEQAARAITARTADVPVSQPARIADQPARGTEQAARIIEPTRVINFRNADAVVMQAARGAEQAAVTTTSTYSANANRVILQVATANTQSTRAAEQPLRTAEQPLRAAEQPLRTAEQPLRTAEQPLRTAEQPLRAGERPLRVAEQPVLINNSTQGANPTRVILQIAAVNTTGNATVKETSPPSAELPAVGNQTHFSNPVQSQRTILQVSSGKEQLGQPLSHASVNSPAATRSVDQPVRADQTQREVVAINWRPGSNIKHDEQPLTLTVRQPMQTVGAQPTILTVLDQRTASVVQNAEHVRAAVSISQNAEHVRAAVSISQNAEHVRAAVSVSQSNDARAAVSPPNIDRAVQVTYFQIGNQIYVLDRRLVQSSEQTAAGDNAQTAAGSAYILAGALLASRRLKRRKRNANFDSSNSIEYSDLNNESSNSEYAETAVTTNGATRNHALLERASNPTRCTYMVQPGDSLSDLAQLIWQDKDVAWLILQVNQLESRWQDDTCIVKLAARQIIEIPLPEEVVDFQKTGRAQSHRHHRMLTIISYSQIDKEVKTLLRA